jgi:hypothetical protein
MTPKANSWIYLAPNPKSVYKQLYIKGTRIPARVLHGLYMSEEQGPPETIEEIAEMYGLPIEAVKEASPTASPTRRSCSRTTRAKKRSWRLRG